MIQLHKIYSYLYLYMFEFQGAFVLCRVIKKNEVKTNSKSLKNKNEDIGSGYSSLATSPCRDETLLFQSFKPSSTANDSSSIWISPDFILDSSKVSTTT